VTYSTANFLDKNKDYVVAEHQALLEGSGHEFVRGLFPSAAAGGSEGGGGNGGGSGGGSGATPNNSRFAAFKFNSVGTQFKRQLAELMAQLNAMEPHYVRCIKPNAASSAGVFEGANALHQLRCGGVLEAVRISCAGFPSKTPYPAFSDRFWPLVPDVYRAELARAREQGGADAGLLGGDGTSLLDDGARRVALACLTAAGIDVPLGAQLGHTKVFLRAGQMAVLDKRRLERLNAAATAIQRRVRGVQGRQAAGRRRDAVLALQSGARGMLARRQARWLREERAATVIQSAWRAHVLRHQYQGAVQAVVALQSAWRAALARRALGERRAERAALRAQTCWRASRARRDFVQQREAALLLQRAARCKQAVEAIRALQREQREAGKLLQDNKALEARLGDAAATLERVQGQRDAARAELKSVRSEAERSKADAAEREAAAKAEVDALRGERDALVTELGALKEATGAAKAAQRAEAEAAKKKAAGDKAEADKQLKVAQDYIQRLMAERGDLERRLHGMKEELIARLQNACAQRDEARAQAMELEARLGKASAEVDEEKQKRAAAEEAGAAAAAAAVAAAASASATVTAAAGGGAGGAGDKASGVRGLMQSLATQAPGYARSLIADATGGAVFGAGGAGAPEHVHGAAAGAAAAISAETELERRARELQARQQQLLLERRRQEEERLLAALQQPDGLGFSRGRPVAALAVFRACLQWRAFQADRTQVFDRIIAVIGAQIERHQDDNARLAYWLTNTVTLLALMQKNVKPASSSSGSSLLGGGLKGRAAAAGRSVLGGLFGGAGSAGGAPPPSGGAFGGASPYGAAGRVAASGEASIHGGGVGGFRAVEAKYPALLFKQQLDAFVQKVFPMVRDNVKKGITPLLAHCIHTPRGGGGAGGGGGGAAAALLAAHGGAGAARRSSSGAPAPAHQSGATAAAAADSQSRAWADILAALDDLLATCAANHVPRPLVRSLFRQLFAFINVQLFNQLLLRRECCSFSNGEYVKTGLGRVEQWIMEAGVEAVGDSWDELRFIRQAVTFLVVGNKPRKALDDITRDLCPVLSVQQLYRISTMYWDDKYQTETVSSEVLAQMKARMVENAALAAAGGIGGGGVGAASHSFLLDDDSTLPFAPAEVCAQLDDRDLYAAISPLPEALRDGGGAGGGAAAGGGSSFGFLEKELRFSAPAGGGMM
jgi:myosin V